MTNLLITVIIILAILVVAKVIRVLKLNADLKGVDPPIVPKNSHV